MVALVDSRQDLDTILTSWRTEPPRFADEEQAIAYFEAFIPLGDEWFTVTEVRSADWKPESVYEITHQGLEDERIEELAAGAEPTEEERELLREEVESSQIYSETIDLYSVLAPSKAQAWFVTVSEGSYYGYLDAAGPFLDLPSAISWIVAKIDGWDSWWILDWKDDGLTLLQEVRSRVTTKEKGGP